MNRIIMQIGDRTVYWEVDPGTMALIAQNLVQTLGPAEEEE